MTPTGTSVALIGVAIGLIGWALGYPVLPVIGLGMVASVAVACLLQARRPTLEVERELQPLRVERGNPAWGVVSVTNRGRSRTGRLLAVEPVGDRRVTVDIRPLGRGQRSSLPYRLPTDRRGAIEVGPLVLLRRDPFGLCEMRQPAGEVATLWVRPRVRAIEPRPGGRNLHLEGPASNTASQGSLTFHTLREYVRGDDLRKVHWRTSARTGTLMVRQHVDTTLPSTVVVLDARSGSYLAEEGLFEEAVDVAASVVAASLGRGFPVRLLSTDGTVVGSRPGEGGQQLTDHLASVTSHGGGGSREGGGGLDRIGAEVLRGRDHDTIVVVTGSLGAPDLAAVSGMTRGFDTAVLVTLQPAGQRRLWEGGIHIDAQTAADALKLWGGRS